MKTNRGFIGLIVIILIALVAAKFFFDFSIFEWLSTDKGREVVAYLARMLRSLKDLLLSAWNYIH